MEKEKVRKVIEKLVHACYHFRDTEAILACVTEDINWIGTESNDSANGKKELRNLLKTNANAATLPVPFEIMLDQTIFNEITDRVMQVFVSGQQIKVLNGDEKYSVRITAICIKSGNQWLISSIHFSIPNTEMEKYRLEKELDENRKKEQMLMAGIPGGVAIYRMQKDGRVLTEFVSDGLARMCGYENTEEFHSYLSSDAMINVVKEDIPRVMDAAARSLATHQTISVMYRIHVKNGKDILQRLDANIIDSELSEEDLSVWYAVHTIVSDESKAILREQKNLQELIDEVPTGIGIYEVSDGQVFQRYMNKAFYEMLGSTREKRDCYFGKNTLNAAHPEDIEKIQSIIKSLYRGDDISSVTYRLRIENDRWFWVHLTASVVERRENFIKIYAAFSNYNEIMYAQQALESNRNTLRIALQAAKIFSWRYDCKQDRIVDSGTLGEAFHLPKVIDQVPQAILDMGFVSGESEKDFRRLYEVAKTEKTAEADIKSTVVGEHGEEWFHQIFTPVFDENGIYVESIGIAMNITEQKQREQHYEEQLHLNKIATQDALSKVNLNLSKNTVMLFESSVSDFEEHKKFKTADALLCSIEKTVMDKNEREKFAIVANSQVMIESFKAGSTHFEIIFHRNDSTRWLRATYDMMENPYTGDIEAISAIHDATESVRSELVVNQLLAIDYESIALINLKNSMVIPLQNSYRDENLNEVIDLQMQRADGPGGLEKFFQMYAVKGTAKKAIQDNSIETVKEKLETAAFYECTYSLNKTGEQRHYRVIYSYLEKDQGALLSAVQDITEIYEQEEKQKAELATALEEAKAANEAKTAFLSRISHDMRTPLNGILGLTTLMKDLSVDPIMTQDLAQLELSGQYLLNLINDTLDVSRIESGKLELHPTVCDSRVVFNNVQSLMRPGMEAKNIRLEMQAEHLPFTLLYVDEGRLQQIAMNILGNAVKFTPEGGTIRCTAKTLSMEGGVVTDHFVIEDNGCGMSKEFLPHLFEAFSQEDAATTNSKQGTGLGMTITKRLVEMMDGEISVSSQRHKGTRFDVVLRLPIATKEQVETWNRNLHSHAINYNLQDKRILLCEDHPLNTKIATRLLSQKGMQVEHAENGKVAVSMFETSPSDYYDAILMDIRMPVMDGIDATRTIRALSRPDAHTIPIIAMTANALRHDVICTQKAGMNAHLSKPIEPERLFGVLEQFISTNQQYIRQRILIVDDIELNRTVIREALKSTYEVYEASNGTEALSILKMYHGMDAVVTDIQMPEMDGVELIRQIRTNDEYRHIVVIANTQYENPGQEEMLLALGANDFIYKPVNPDIVKIRVRNALRKI